MLSKYGSSSSSSFQGLSVNPSAFALRNQSHEDSGYFSDMNESDKKRAKNDHNIRVSITFKIGPSWRGTRSRDFPGRKFAHEDR